MNRCDSTRDSLTAWIDGELSPSDEREVEAHVGTCTSCATEAESLRHEIDWQKRILPNALLDAPVDVVALKMGLQRQLNTIRRQEERPVSYSWGWLIRPLAMATAGLALTLLVVVWRAGEPESLLVSIGVEDPPAEVATRPDMFKYLDVIENLEALEHFEAVQAVRLEDERAHLDVVRHG